MKTLRNIVEGDVVQFKKSTLSNNDHKRGYFMAQNHKSVDDAIAKAAPLLDDIRDRKFTLMQDGLPKDVNELKTAITNIHKATEHMSTAYRHNTGIYLNHGSKELSANKPKYISDVDHHDNNITSFEDGYGDKTALGLPKNFTSDHLKNHIITGGKS